MQCSQCSRPAMFEMNGYYLCIEHNTMMVNANNDRLRLLMALQNDTIASAYASFGMAPPHQIQIPPREVVKNQHMTVNDHSVHIDRSMIGVVNTGVIDTLNASVTQIQQVNPEVAEQIRNLVEAVSKDQTLLEDAKKEIIEQISYLTAQTTVPEVGRNPSVMKATAKAIGIGLGTSADLLTLWQALHPILAGMLGLQ